MDIVRRHWVFGLLLAAGLVLRVVAQLGYEPALLFIDSKKYIFGTQFSTTAWGSFDPIGYTLLVLRPVLMFADLAFVALLQHVAGIAMAAALYVLMLRRGVTRWLAALAVAPVLLDAYQLNAEQTIMPDVLFEALLVAGIVLLLWQPRPGLAFVILGGLALGASAPVRQVGEALIVPALIYVLAVAPGWRTRLLHGAALTLCFALPVVGYMSYSAVILHYGFELSNMGNAYLYGRAAHAADCATLKIPADEQPLCPSPSVAASLGVDGLVNAKTSPRVTYQPVNVQLGIPIDTLPMQTQFAYSVLAQQPMRVAGDIAKDSVKIFALTRNTEEGDTPISRWQFQTSYPYYPPGITHYGPNSASNVFAAAGGGGKARVNLTAATALRDYQLYGGYTPGPVFLLTLLAGLAGIFTFRRRRDAGLALACLLITGSAVAVLLGADLYEFSWRYQLPALVTLPIAGAFGATAVARHIRARRRPPQSPPPARRTCRRAGQSRIRAGSLADACPGRRPGYSHARLRHRLRRQLDAPAPGRDPAARRFGRHVRVRREVRLRPGHPGRERRFPPSRGVPLPDRAAHLVVPPGRVPERESGDPEELARLELAQETGLRARVLVRLGSLHGAHGLTSQVGHYFVATGLEPGSPERESEEQDMRQAWVPRARFEEMIGEGAITDAPPASRPTGCCCSASAAPA